MEVNGREVIFWDEPDSERLRYDSKDEAMNDILDEMASNETPYPEEIVLAGFARMDHSLSIRHLERIIEDMDDEHADPEGDTTEPSAAMIEAWNVFCQVWDREYKSWTCEEVTRETVNVKDWLASRDLPS